MALPTRVNTKILIFISSLLSICLVLIIAINANRNLVEMSRNNSELYSAYRISELMKAFKSNLNILENKRKGYVITGDAKFLEAVTIKESEIKTHLKSMEKYFSGKPEEESFYKLKDLTYKRLLEYKTLGSSSSLAGFQGNSDVEENGAAAAEIKAVTDEINESLAHTTKVLLDNSVEYVNASKAWSFAEVSFGIIVALLALFIVFRDINIRTKLEKELRHAKLQAEESVKLKEQFMANMSHEIRTPLNAILGFSNLMEKTPVSGQQGDYLKAIKNSSSNLLNIINDILDFSKLEAGKLSIDKVPFNLAELLNDIQTMFEAKARGKNITLQTNVDKQIPEFLFGDPNRLTQVLVNLVNNAVKFTEEGSVTLSCEIKNVEHDIAQFVFRVKDSGIGIPADKLQDIFERFNQGSSDTTRKYGGTGLGLAIVKDLIEIQNGDIQVKSKEHQGSEFIVTLAYPIAFTESEGKTKTKIQLRGLSEQAHTVLLAEDNDLNQKLAKNYLEGFGLLVEIAENGAEAIEKIKRKSYDLVLMDIQMPLMDGYQATKTIREELHSKVPIIAMTANSMVGEKEKCQAMGMDDYLSKPFKEAELHQVIGKFLSKKNTTKIKQGSIIQQEEKTQEIDLEDFYVLTRGNKKFMQEMIQLFLERNPVDLAQLEAAIEKQDFQVIHDLSHRMKTSVGFMGMKQLVETLNDIELLSETKTGLEKIKPWFRQIKLQCEKGRGVFETEFNKLASL